MLHERDPCPKCGYRKKPLLMSIDPNAPGYVALLKGSGHPLTQRLAWAGVMFAAVLALVGVLAVLHIQF